MEEAWKTGSPRLLAESIPREAQSLRRNRLAICGICRLSYPKGTKRCPTWIDTVERYADGLVTNDDPARLRIVDTLGAKAFQSSRLRTLLYLASLRTVDLVHTLTVLKQKNPQATQASDIIRDIFGNPFRPVPFDPAWRTSTAVGLAETMYAGRDFAAMPILADALQDAGCEHADVLAHCLDPQQVHVRGCWVVDLVLGKS